jgi:transcriptional regulator with XRE-family HTH domain
MMKQERRSLSWTQEHVAQRAGITLSAVQKIETGQRRPSFDVLVKLEDLFEMDYRDLFNLPQRQLRDGRKEPGGNPVEA